MNLYYWNAKKNFGDQLAPLLIKKFTHMEGTWSKPEDSSLIVCGSILEHMPKGWGGVVAGVGKLHATSVIDLSSANVLALRGPLSAKGIKGDYILADPGLLADELIPNQDKIYDLGIIPHWTDKTLEYTPTFLKYSPKIIRVADDPLKVIKEIAQCKKIVSSSLHGIILADAFGIPRRIELPPRTLSHPRQEGGIFKWMDYSASINMEFITGKTQEPNRYTIIEKQNELFDTFEHIKKLFHKTN